MTTPHEAEAERLRRLAALGGCRWCGETHGPAVEVCPNAGKSVLYEGKIYRTRQEAEDDE